MTRMTQRRRALAAVAAGLALAATAVVASTGEDDAGRQQGQTKRSDSMSLYVVPVTGGEPRELSTAPETEGDETHAKATDHTHDPGTAGHKHDDQPEEEETQIDTPSFSPDGRRFAYTKVSCEYCQSRLWVAPARDPGRAREVARVRNPFQASWSPDGRRLAVVQPTLGISVVDVRTGASRLVVPAGDRSVESPAWSPTDDRILFIEQRSATNWDIYAADARTKRRTRVTSTAAQETGPTWSPDGRRIAFARQDETGAWRILAMSARGGPATPLTPRGVSAVEPAFSPDGRTIAATGQQGDDSFIWVISLGGGKPRRVTTKDLFASQPEWSPDGERLLFVARALE